MPSKCHIFDSKPKGIYQDDLISICGTPLLTEGIDTTSNGIAAAIYTLASYPDQWRLLRENPSLAGSAFEETIRWESTVQTFFRTTTREVEVTGVRIPAGEKVLLFL